KLVVQRRRPRHSRHGARMSVFSFRLLAVDGRARRGEISMPRGTIRTPAFMPVGTGGTVKAMYMDQVRGVGADIILGNTYHLMLDRKSTRLNSSHVKISYAVFCLKKKKNSQTITIRHK